MQQVVIIGMGFGGLNAARELMGKDVQVTIVDRQNYHLFQALLYQVATATQEPESIAYPVRAIIRGAENMRFVMAEVTGIDLAARRVETSKGPLAYDYLIAAAGAVTHFFGMQGVEDNAFHLKYLDDAVRLRSHVLNAFEQAAHETDPQRKAALLTFVVVGGGPTGVEFTGALSELIRNVLCAEYPEIERSDPRIMLLEARDRLLPGFHEELVDYAVKRLRNMGIEVRLNTRVIDARPDAVVLDGGEEIAATTLVWTAGVQTAKVAAMLGVDSVQNGRIPVAADLSLLGHSSVYIVGDMAYLEQDGRPLPMMAPVAIQGGKYAGRAILARERGETPKPFRYTDPVEASVIGRGKAVASIGKTNVTGLIAWLVWLFLHLQRIVSFRNRLTVLYNWMLDYLFFDRKVRLITGRTGDGSGEG